MADDRIMHDDEQRNLRTKDDEDFVRQSPGRGGQMGQQGDPKTGEQGGQKGARNLDDDEDFDTGRSSEKNRGGQNR